MEEPNLGSFFVEKYMPRENVQTRSEGVAVIANDISYIKRDLTDIKAKLEANYVTHEEFEPIKKIVYGLVGLILVAVVTAVLTLVIMKP